MHTVADRPIEVRAALKSGSGAPRPWQREVREPGACSRW
jgi:hypothetical protein